MIIDPDGPTQESVAFFNQNGFIIPEEMFITEEVFLSDDFTAYIKTIIEEVFEKMNKKFCILQAEYLENNGDRRKAIYTYLEENYNEYTGFASDKKKYLILCKKVDETEIKEKAPEMVKCSDIYMERMMINKLDYLKEKEELRGDIEKDQIEQELREKIIQLPKITKCTISNITDSSADISIDEIKQDIILSKNSITELKFKRKYKDTKVEYIIFFYNSTTGQYDEINNYEIKNNKAIFKVEHLQSKQYYTFKISIKFDRFLSQPETNFYFYTKASSSKSSSLLVYGKNTNNSLLISPIRDDIETDPFINTPTPFGASISNFDFFNDQTIVILSDDTSVINSGKFYYNIETGAWEIEKDSINNPNIKISFSKEPFKIEFNDANLSFKEVGVGAEHCIILTNQGECYSWGENFTGQLGRNEDKEVIIPIPKKIEFQCEGNKNVFITDIQTGSCHNLALGLSKGKRVLFFWGLGKGHEMAKGFSMSCSTVPLIVPFDDVENIVKIYAKYQSNSIICWNKNKKINVLYNFGLNLHYQLGFYNNLVDEQKNWDIPTKIEYFENNLLNVLDIKYSDQYSMVLAENQDNKKELYLSGVVPYKKELIKQYTKEELPFVDDIIEMAPGLHALYFLLKSGIIKKIEKNQSIIDIEISKEEMNKLDFEDCTRMKMIAFDDNFALMIGNKVEK